MVIEDNCFVVTDRSDAFGWLCLAMWNSFIWESAVKRDIVDTEPENPQETYNSDYLTLSDSLGVKMLIQGYWHTRHCHCGRFSDTSIFG